MRFTFYHRVDNIALMDALLQGLAASAEARAVDGLDRPLNPNAPACPVSIDDKGMLTIGPLTEDLVMPATIGVFSKSTGVPFLTLGLGGPGRALVNDVVHIGPIRLD